MATRTDAAPQPSTVIDHAAIRADVDLDDLGVLAICQGVNWAVDAAVAGGRPPTPGGRPGARQQV
ncbi:hypothetical protein ACWGCW_38005 [Streptomyces sp. NPDC054933]